MTADNVNKCLKTDQITSSVLLGLIFLGILIINVILWYILDNSVLKKFLIYSCDEHR